MNMNEIKLLNGPSITPSSGKVEKIVLFIHGYGASGNDLIGIGKYWKDRMPNTAFYSPNAPFICDFNPSGFQWFPLNERTKKELKDGLDTSEPFLENYVKKILDKNNLEPEKLIVVGFSQGTILSLFHFTKSKKSIGGLIGYSGLLFDNQMINKYDITTPILLYHGQIDAVIQSSSSIEAKEILIKKGFDVECIIKKDLEHGIDEGGIIKGEEFIIKKFNL